MSDYDARAQVYDAWSADMTEGVPYYVELVREADGPVVELTVDRRPVADDSRGLVWVARTPA